MIHITNNVSQLSVYERDTILENDWYVYTYGIGIIFMRNCSWDCTNTAEAKKYLDSHGMEEKLNPPSYEQQKGR